MSVEDFRRLRDSGQVTKKGRIVVSGKAAETKKSKFGNEVVIDDETGEKVDSKREMKHRKEYRAMVRRGEIAAYASQVIYFLVKDLTYVADHVITHLDGRVEVIDSKGMITRGAIDKKKLMKELRGIDVIFREK